MQIGHYVGFILIADLLVLSSQSEVITSSLESGPHHVIWRAVENRTVDGQQTVITNSYVQIESGLNYWDEASQSWQPSSDEIELINGGAVASKLQHKIIFSPNFIDEVGTIDFYTPDAKRIRSRVIGLAYTEADTGRSVFIAEVQDSIGVLVGKNQVLYENAFDNVNADVRYTVTKGSFEQDVILKNGIAGPEAYGLNPLTSKLEVWTQILESPEPVKEIVRVPRTNGEEDDEHLDFGMMKIGAGKAFSIRRMEGNEIWDEQSSRAITKSWQAIEGAKFLIETVPYQEAKPDLDRLEAPDRQAKIDREAVQRLLAKQHSSKPKLPVSLASLAQHKQQNSTTERKLARIKRSIKEFAYDNAFVLDYLTINGSLGAYTLKADTTYFVSGAVYVSSLIIEGGTVVKMDTVASGAKIQVNGAVTCLTDFYRPAIFTGKDDRTLGDVIAGSANSPTGKNYGNPMLAFSPGTYGAFTLKNIRMSWAATGVTVNGAGAESVIMHAQFVNCATVLNLSGGNIAIRNALFCDTSSGTLQTVLAGQNSTVTGEHWTVHNALSVNGLTGSSSATLYNSLVVGAANVGTVLGGYNDIIPSDFGIFNTVGAGGHYLVANSPYRNTGTTGLSSTLLGDLSWLTTYPPVELTGPITANTALFPQAQRDTRLPDRGYHYAPIDFAVSGVAILGATLTLTNGVAVAVYGDTGFKMQAGSKLISEGTPIVMNRFMRYHVVQEQINNNWTGGIGLTLFKEDLTSGTPPEARFRFTESAIMAGSGTHFNGGTKLSILSYLDCRLLGGGIQHNIAGTSSRSIQLNNSVFERMSCSFGTGSDSTLTLSARNSLFRYCSLSLNAATYNSWSLYDNFFESSYLWRYYGYFGNGYNGYWNTSPPSNTSGNDVTVSSSPFTTGFLGAYYIANVQLRNVGSQSAANAGLYHHTTQSDQQNEASTQVDIGFHYVALPKVNFAGSESVTQGNWVGKYGSDGYNIIQDSVKYPMTVAVTPTGKSDYIWHSAPTDARALQRTTSAGRIAACWYADPYFEILLAPKDNRPHRLGMYCIDWDTFTRVQTVDVRDAVTGTIYNSQNVSAFNGGRYLYWDVMGDVKVRITKSTGNAVVSGIFFDEASTKDSDGDGLLPDYLEDRNGNNVVESSETNPNSLDTDGDGMSDGKEFAQGRNPNAGAIIDASSSLINLRMYSQLN
jgi:hypothetical protein